MNYSPFEGRNAIVTGASRGIGRGIALKLASRGARVFVADVNLEAAEETDELCGNNSIALELNVADSDEVQATIAKLISEHGKIDVLVNNAGINRDAMLHKMTDEQWDSVLAVDLTGVFYLCREVGAHMRTNGY